MPPHAVSSSSPSPSRNGHFQRRSLWLDCDPGHDDALALLLAIGNASVRPLGVSTVHGNQTLSKVTTNALKVLQLLGCESVIPVYAGAPRPLQGSLEQSNQTCPEIHGECGLGGPRLEECAVPPRTDVPAIVAMHDALKKAYEEEGQRPALVATGALTNVALMLSVYPDCVDFVEIVFMGGAVGEGNTGAVAEFNIQTDAHAASIVMEHGTRMPVTMVPLEVTHTAIATKEVQASLARHGRVGNVVNEWLAFFADTYRDVFGFLDGPPVHDPCAVAFVIDPSIFTDVRHVRVDVETASPLSLGQTVCDVRGKYGRGATRSRNVNVCFAMDVPAFWRMMDQAVDATEQSTRVLNSF
ncbi:hypothetical protein PPROV_000018100 [Pycnococcus provasolii]|uniref:Inosine/uridine-preferring nucleoside hydrolase domain-containing protein n=1 Tax=Pycnococcus provasolii TaxID=41880 RepID=A0A830H2S7_9CHLO|nr:hypothetical protein PPROV_000018100 [Pycnococcus provasolii]